MPPEMVALIDPEKQGLKHLIIWTDFLIEDDMVALIDPEKQGLKRRITIEIPTESV